MVRPLIVYTGALVAAAAALVWLATYTWRLASVAGARYFSVSMAAVAAWSLASVATHLSSSLGAKLFWTNLQYVGIALVPATWLLFALAYTGRGSFVTPRLLALLTVHPVLLQVFVWANPYHLFRTRVWLDTTGAIPTMGNDLGPAFWVHTVYSYCILGLVAYLLIRAHWSTARIYRRQGLALMIAISVPWMANVATIVGATSLSHLDLTPFAFAISGVVVTWGLLRHGLLDLVPVARSIVIRSLSSGIVVLDHHDRVVDLNPAAEEILGVKREKVAGKVFGEVLPHYSYLMTRHRDIHETRDEMVVGEGDNRKVYDLRISALHDIRKRVVGHLLSLQDISERKESQTTLSRYAERLRILHEIDQAILAAQSPQKIAAAALEQIHHLLPTQRMSVVAFSGANQVRLLAIRAPGRLSRGRTPWEEAVASGHFALREVVCVNQVTDGESGDWLSRRLYHEGVRAYLVVPLVVQQTMVGTLNLESATSNAFTAEHIDVASQIATSLAVALENARLYAAAQQEISERKLAETALRASEASLRQKAEDLAARNAELDAFAHTVAHDLKTPLSLLTGYTSFIAAGEVADSPDQLDWCIRAIGQSARKMHNIIDELLLLSSVRKMDEVALQPLDMGEIVSDVLIRLTDITDQEHAKIDVPKVWPIAWGYAPWIEEVWANYISNALKYGGIPPQIEVGATILDAGEPGDVTFAAGSVGAGNRVERIQFWVKDNGGGLTEDQQARLFIPFERLDQARAKGYGLGLSIVQRIMEKLNGSAGVASSGIDGEGSTFDFILPRAELP